ncbi:MAG TPA: hypothetical protein VII09_05350, partial [Opitutaceae bacterium]
SAENSRKVRTEMATMATIAPFVLKNHSTPKIRSQRTTVLVILLAKGTGYGVVSAGFSCSLVIP